MKTYEDYLVKDSKGKLFEICDKLRLVKMPTKPLSCKVYYLSKLIIKVKPNKIEMIRTTCNGLSNKNMSLTLSVMSELAFKLGELDHLLFNLFYSLNKKSGLTAFYSRNGEIYSKPAITSDLLTEPYLFSIDEVRFYEENGLGGSFGTKPFIVSKARRKDVI